MAGNFNIVTVNVNETIAATPSLLQQSGALVSQGGSTLAANAYQFLTQLSDLLAIQPPALPVTTLAWSGGVVTATLPTFTVSSGTYNTTSGLVTLTLSTSMTGLVPGSSVNVPTLSGTGSFASAEGTQTAAVGSSGTTLEYSIATGLTMTITGGTVEFNLGNTSQTFLTTIAGEVPAGYNGTYVATVASATSFTYPLATNPGVQSNAGTYTRPGVAELFAMATTFFAQGNTTGAFVLELGSAAFPSTGITDLSTWITANPGIFYAYLCPEEWDEASGFTAFLQNFESTTAKTYFFVTTTAANLANYTAQMKDVFALVESPLAPTTEFTCAAPFFSVLNNQPSAVSKVPPMSYRFMTAVTPWLLPSNQTTINTILGLNGNIILSGAEGGISNATLYKGTTADGNDFSFWYSVDWVQIQSKQALANAVINGSNDPQNPLYYNQDGINRLRAIEQQTMNSGVAFGLVLAPITVTATPFFVYTQQNPNDYAAGKYNGLAVTYTPQLGFKSVTFNVQVDQFVQQPASQGG